MLDEQELTALRENCLRIDCPQVRLARPSGHPPAELSGPGYVYQADSGRLEFFTYPQGDLTGTDFVGDYFQHQAGQVIPVDDLYTLQATDWRGRLWTADHIRIDTTQGPGGLVVRGWLQDLREDESDHSAVERHVAEGFIFTDTEIPRNAHTHLTEDRPGTKVEKHALDCFVFETLGYRFVLRQLGGVLHVELAGATPFPRQLAHRVLEGLSVILARPLEWGWIMQVDLGRAVTAVYGSRSDEHGYRLKPPIAARTPMQANDCARLFDAYVKHVIQDEASWAHPVSIYVLDAIRASSASIQTESLVLSVAVEGLTKQLYSAIATPDAKLLEQVDAVLTHIDGLKDLPGDLQLDDGVRGRVYGAVQAMRQARSKDRLLALVERGVITRRQYQSWDALRNPSAHGDMHGDRDLQELVDLLASVHVMLYRLVFGAIGYAGSYTDYATRNWPERHYPPQGPEGE